jgi:hypothetical protein
MRGLQPQRQYRKNRARQREHVVGDHCCGFRDFHDGEG